MPLFLALYTCPKTELKEIRGEIDSASEVLIMKGVFNIKGSEKTLLIDCRKMIFDIPLLYGVGVIINSALNPEVSLVSCCQGRLCPDGVICSNCSASLPICLERKNNGFSITLYFSNVHGRLSLCSLTITASSAFCLQYVSYSKNTRS